MRRQMIGAVFSQKTADNVIKVLADAFEADLRNPIEERLKVMHPRTSPAKPPQPPLQKAPSESSVFLTQTDVSNLSSTGGAELESKSTEPFVRPLTATPTAPPAPARVASPPAAEIPLAPLVSARSDGSDLAAMPAEAAGDRTEAARSAYLDACTADCVLPISK